MTDSQTDTVTVFVRLCGEGQKECRELSFRIPEGISQAELLDEGYAIDGHSATYAVTPYHQNDDEYVPLADALLFAQRRLVTWLDNRGYGVIFK